MKKSLNISSTKLNLLDDARIRIIVIPIHPIRTETFKKYLDCITKFHQVYIGDLNPPHKNTNKYTEKLYHSGHVNFNFVTSYNKEHQPLEDFQLNKQIFGIIGIMHCQQVSSLTDGYKKFKQLSTRYPTSLTSRCFAFEPSENQADDVKGPIMIPNVGHLDFYLNTMMTDFSSELLGALGTFATQIEKRNLISGPIMISPLNVNTSYSVSSPQTPLNNPNSPNPNQSSYSANARDAALEKSEASGFSNLGGLLNTSDKNKKRTPSRAQKLIGDIFLLAGRSDVAVNIYQAAIETLKINADYLWQAAALESHCVASLIVTIEKAGLGPQPPDESTPSKQKFETEDSVKVNSILDTNNNSFSKILGASNENSTLRNSLSEVPERFREIIILYEKAFQPGHQGFYPITQIAACLKIAKFLACLHLGNFHSFFSGGANFPLNVAETKMITDIAQAMGGSVRSAVGNSIPQTGPSGQNPLDRDRIVLYGGLGVMKVDVNSWIMKAWSSGIEYLSMSDQIWAVSTMAALFGLIGYKRKHSFFLRQTGLVVLSSMKSNANIRRLSGIQSYQHANDSNSSHSGVGSQLLSDSFNSSYQKPTSETLECMRHVCSALGIGGKDDAFVNVKQVDEDDWLTEYFDDLDLDGHRGVDTVVESYKKRIALSRVRFGWPELQINVLKEAIDIAEASDDYSNAIIYITRLLRRLHKHLSKQEQIELSEKLQGIVIKNRIQSEEPNLMAMEQNCAELSSILVKNVIGGVIGVPVLRRLDIIRQTLRKLPIKHSITELSSSKESAVLKSKDPFIYNPYDKKNGKKNFSKKEYTEVILVVNEPVYFDVTVANPFSFSLDIQSIVIRTSGIAFKSNSTSTIVEGGSRNQIVKVSGVPLESGVLRIHGCTVRMFGGSVEENIDPVSKFLDDPTKSSKDGKKRKQNDRERVGKILSFQKKKGEATQLSNDEKILDTETGWSIDVKVIEVQPVLRADLGFPVNAGALMLFEGEKMEFPIILENISSVKINYLAISIKENYSKVAETVIETAEDAFERDVYDYSLRTFWLKGKSEGEYIGKAINQTIIFELFPGETTEIVVCVYGKRYSTGGVIKVEYGYIPEMDKSELEDFSSTEKTPKTFFTRQLFIPVLISVQEALIVSNKDILLFGKDSMFLFDNNFSQVNEEKENKIFYNNRSYEISKENQDLKVSFPVKLNPLLKLGNNFLSLEEMMVDPFGDEQGEIMKNLPSSAAKDYCLLTFDLRNVWSHPFEVQFEIYEDESNNIKYSFSTVVHSNSVKRVILPIKRLWLPKEVVEAAIPIPDWKQFVVGKTQKFSDVEEKKRRSLFWYKEYLIGGLNKRGRIVSKWTYSKERTGLFNLRSIHLSSGMLNSLVIEEISFSTNVNNITRNGVETSQTIIDMGGSTYQCQTGDMVELEWTVTNKREFPMNVCFRIQPVQDMQNGEVVMKSLEEKILCLGSLQILSSMKAKSDVKIKLPCLLLKSGIFKFFYHCENFKQENLVTENIFWGGEPIVLNVV
ncbi:hypothetical protein HDU92_003791 [Lobulomyces angularis]|nr:hypothetical protein HDU92_003791 [Lobulomyces angularis]